MFKAAQKLKVEKEPFWKRKALSEMSKLEWESLCDGCGRCCLNKLENEDTLEIYHTNVACRLLNMETCKCSSYEDRKRFVPECQILTARNLKNYPWLPSTCAYRMLSEGNDLAWWHPLVSGDPNTVNEAEISVRGRIVSERDTNNLENHIVSWPA